MTSTINFYDVAGAIGVAAWLSYSTSGFIRSSVPRESALGASISALILGVLGARLFSGFLALGRLPTLSELLHFERGGFAFHGFVLGVVIGIAAAAQVVRARLPELLDAAAPAMALATACWRTGCFFNGCCWGIITYSRFDLPLPGHHSPPTIGLPLPLFEACFLISVFLALHALTKRQFLPKGCIAALYLSFHAAYRVAADVWRPDYSNVFYGISVFLLIFGGLWLLKLRGQARLNKRQR
ncbi:prolipoprotein diacylglyceryl transferase [Candidatus Ozemobacteraceae bacterium]|mgnify:CR=1 FL=1|nr:prolipoprotein diacylglyceryl transferase [Candidatus Ozemobacteraceae bacterium]